MHKTNVAGLDDKKEEEEGEREWGKKSMASISCVESLYVHGVNERVPLLVVVPIFPHKVCMYNAYRS
jgi:hypothetical protein